MLNVWCWVTVNSGLIGFLFGWFYNKNKGGWPSSEDLSETKITAPHLYATLQTKLNKIQSGRPTSSYLALDVLHTQLLWACHRYLVQGRIVWNYIIWIMLRCQSYSLFVPSHPTWTGETRSNLFPTFDEVIIHPRIAIITVNLKKVVTKPSCGCGLSVSSKCDNFERLIKHKSNGAARSGVWRRRWWWCWW